MGCPYGFDGQWSGHVEQDDGGPGYARYAAQESGGGANSCYQAPPYTPTVAQAKHKDPKHKQDHQADGIAKDIRIDTCQHQQANRQDHSAAD